MLEEKRKAPELSSNLASRDECVSLNRYMEYTRQAVAIRNKVDDRYQTHTHTQFEPQGNNRTKRMRYLFVYIQFRLLLYFTINNTSSLVFISSEIFCYAHTLSVEIGRITANTNWFEYSSSIHFGSLPPPSARCIVMKTI